MTGIHSQDNSELLHFNSHPHEEDDELPKNHLLRKRISTHILTKRMTVFIVGSGSSGGYFNSHPHEEDDAFRLYRRTCTSGISTHILTKRMTDAWRIPKGRQEYFNSHPHEEDDADRSCCCHGVEYFKSHPHEEDDSLIDAEWQVAVISIHILTNRMTYTGCNKRVKRNISIHILTKRMTTFLNPLTIPLTFQFTSSRRG